MSSVENTRKNLHSNLVIVLFLVLESKGLHKYNTTRKNKWLYIIQFQINESGAWQYPLTRPSSPRLKKKQRESYMHENYLILIQNPSYIIVILFKTCESSVYTKVILKTQFGHRQKIFWKICLVC